MEVAMAPKLVKPNLLDKFELVSEVAQKMSGASFRGDQTEQRRKKFVDGVEIQKSLWENPDFTITKIEYVPQGPEAPRKGVEIEKRPRPWWRTTHEVAYISPRYGNRPVEIKPKMYTARVPKEQVIEFLDALIEMATTGYFDEQFNKMALGRRRKGSNEEEE